MNPYLTHIVCLECGHEMAAGDTFPTACSHCGGSWLDARYDYAAVAQLWPHVVTPREQSLWRYRELLPLETPDPEIFMGEGYTPLLRLPQYETLYGKDQLYIKDERRQPTNSFKDRQAAMSVTYLRRSGQHEVVLASTGNAAVAYAAYCARAGIKLWLFLTSLVPSEKMREAALYGAEVVKVSGTYDETKKVAAEFAERKGIPMDKGAKTIPSKESMKTMAYEIAEQLGLTLHPDQPDRWQAPDWYVQAVSGGIGPLGVWKGFSELYQMGLIDRVPKLAIVQAAGCAPMVAAFERGESKATPVIPKTLIHVLATGDPGPAYDQLYHVLQTTGGTMIAVEDGETFQAMRRLASHAGLSVEPATAVAFAGLEKMLSQGMIAPDESVIVNCSGHTMPAESHILGDQYDQYILDLNLKGEGGLARQEGLGAALQNLNERVTTVVVIDDNPQDRRLIRRLLQSYKNYRVYEAADGVEGIKVIRDRRPDLVVTDLTMPEMDGIALLNEIKNTPDIAHIPVVVVSAKSITEEDRVVLKRYSESVWTKGGFETRELVDHVVKTLGHTPVEVIRKGTTQPETPTIGPVEVDRENGHVVVVIDDNVGDLKLAKRLIEITPGVQVIEALTGRDGLKAIYNYHPDLIVLDLILPDVDGFAILDTLHRDAKLRDIPVIVFSAKTLTPEERTSIQSKIHKILEKTAIDGKTFAEIIKNELS